LLAKEILIGIYKKLKVECVFGIDIIQGSGQGKTSPKYAVFIIKDGREIEKFGISKAKLFRMIKKYRPSIISIDNVFELFESREELVSFLKNIPYRTKLIQVAGRQSLPSLSKRFGLNVNSRNPMDEARACAYLARLGIGEEVSVFIDKTIITVSRNRSLGRGGWRQNKYRRRVHNAVRHVFNDIKRKIEELGFEYTEDVKIAYGGISKGVLIVNAPKSLIPINSFRFGDVQVRVEAVEKERVEFIPLKKPFTIVGVDPGTTTAVAVLDLNGNLLGVKSKKNWNISEVVEYITSLGKPVVIATDRSNPPEFVLKLKALFQAVLWMPKEDMSVEKKRSLTVGFQFINDHERDAIASAIEAYNSFRNKMRNVEKRIPFGVDVDLIKAEVIRGTPLKDLIESRDKKEEETSKKSERRIETVRKDRILEELEEENKMLKKEIKYLKDEIERLKAKIMVLSNEMTERIKRDNYIRALKSEITELKKELRKKNEVIDELKKRIEILKKMKSLELEGYKVVKVLKKFTRDGIDELDEMLGLGKGDVVLIRDSSGGGKITAEYLCDKDIRAVIVKNEMSHLARSVFEEKEIPVISSDDLDLKEGEYFALVDIEEFERVYRCKVEEMKKKKLERLENIILEYKSMRRNY